MKNINQIIATISKIHHSANRLIINELKKYNLEGLAPSHGDILIMLYQNEQGVPMNKISQSIHKDKSTITALVNKLEKMQLIEKFKNETDSRSTLIRLTQKGLEIKPIIMENISTKLIDTTYAGFSQKEKQTLIDLLSRVKDNYTQY